MEHEIILSQWALKNGMIVPDDKADKLLRYASILGEANMEFNLTGLKNEKDIIEKLVLDSLLPLKRHGVPRGTLFADIGSGSGIPGIPLGIMMPEVNGILIESHRKRSDFIGACVDRLGLANLSVYAGRVEDAAREPGCRERCSAVFSRAFGPLYMVIELGMPLVRSGGYLYIYSALGPSMVDEATRRHGVTLGGAMAVDNDETDTVHGLIFNKLHDTDDKYPRRYPVIKREARRLEMQ